jgi:hypothetical protein
MGAWGHRPFDNDEAADWVYEVEACQDLSHVRSTLSGVIGSEGYLESPDGEAGVAAAEVLAICLGQGSSIVTKSFSAWLTSLTDRPTDGDLQLGVDAIERILGPQSELRETWDESPSGAMWFANLEHLRARLGYTDDRDLYAQIEAMGVDMTQPHQVDWYSYFPTASGALDVARVLRDDHLEVEVSDAEGDGEWPVVASRTGQMTYMVVMRMTNRMRQTVDAHGGTLDGWGMAI